MFKKSSIIILIGICAIVIASAFCYAVFVKPEPVVPVSPVVNDDVTSTPIIEKIIALKEKLPEEIYYWKNPIKVFIDPRPTYEESSKRHKQMCLDRETYTDNVYIKDERTDKEILLMKLNNIDYEIRFGEYHNGHLYIVKKFYDYDTNYQGGCKDLRNELWKYDLGGNKEKIFSNRRINFRVDPKEKFITVNNLILDINTLETKFEMDAKALIHLKPFYKEHKDGESYGDIELGLNQWSSDGKYFWGNLSYHFDLQQFFKVNTENWQVTKYDISSLPISPKEQILNPDVGKIFYSDMPIFVETDAIDKFKQSGKQVALYLYDFNSKKNKVIDKIAADKITYDGLQLEWIDNHTIEYTKNGKRISSEVF
jgi:hypothetical protein